MACTAAQTGTDFSRIAVQNGWAEREGPVEVGTSSVHLPPFSHLPHSCLSLANVSMRVTHLPEPLSGRLTLLQSEATI